MRLDESYVKKYFTSKKTVSKWWDPESITLGWFKALLLDQEKILRKISPEGKIILDAGTGRGRFSINFALAGAKRVIALDLSEEMIKIAIEKAENFGIENRVEFVQEDIENLSFKDEIFDATCCMETFVHLPNSQLAMNELARVTKPGGLIIANVTSNKILWRIRYGYFPKGFEGTWKAMSEKKFCTLFRNANLKIVKVIKQGLRYSPVFIIVISVKPEPESVQSQTHTH